MPDQSNDLNSMLIVLKRCTVIKIYNSFIIKLKTTNRTLHHWGLSKEFNWFSLVI